MRAVRLVVSRVLAGCARKRICFPTQTFSPVRYRSPTLAVKLTPRRGGSAPNPSKFAGLTAKIRSSIVCTRTIRGGGVQPRVDRLTTMQSRPRVVANDKDYVLDDQVGHLLRRAHQRHTSIFQEHIGDFQLTPLQFAALIKLSDLGEVSQNRLGRLTAMDAATMQGVIRRLFARRLIERRPDPTDRRRILLRLSPPGTKLLTACTANGFTVTDRTLEPLSPSERTSLLDLLRRIS